MMFLYKLAQVLLSMFLLKINENSCIQSCKFDLVKQYKLHSSKLVDNFYGYFVKLAYFCQGLTILQIHILTNRINTMIFSVNKENIERNNTQRSIPHPSRQSLSKPFKPSIKVGYEITTSREQVMRRYKRPVIILKHQQKQNLGVKKVQSGLSQIKSGAFINCQYVPVHSNKEDGLFHRKGVAEVQHKIHGSQQFSENLKKQFVKRCKSTVLITQNNSITERSKLSGYRNQGIKDILQYRHAGEYRQNKLAVKCTNQNANNRCLSYRQLHEFDFRKNRQANS